MKRIWNLGRWRIMFKPGRYQWGATTKGFADLVVATRWGIGSLLRRGITTTHE